MTKKLVSSHFAIRDGNIQPLSDIIFVKIFEYIFGLHIIFSMFLNQINYELQTFLILNSA